MQLSEAGYVTFHCGKVGNSCTFGNAAFDTNIETTGRTADSANRVHRSRLEVPSIARRAAAVLRLSGAARCRTIHGWHRPSSIGCTIQTNLTLSANFMPKHPFDNGELDIRDEQLAAATAHPAGHARHLADYYATISHLDHEVGRVIEAIGQRGWADNTVVIYSSDQGLAVGGRHGLMGKQNLYEHVKPPLIVAGPGIPHGKSDALVYLFDLFPTICDLAGAKTPAAVEGRSLLPIIKGEKAGVRECAVRRLPRLPADGSRQPLEVDRVQRPRREQHAVVRLGPRPRRAGEPGC